MPLMINVAVERERERERERLGRRRQYDRLRQEKKRKENQDTQCLAPVPLQFYSINWPQRIPIASSDLLQQ